MDRAPKDSDSLAGKARSSEAPLRLVVANTSHEHELLHARLAPAVYKLLWTFLGPDPERDDLAHEIFIRILRNSHKVRDASKLESWAMRVTMNAIKNEFRRRKLRRLVSFGVDEDSGALQYHPDFEGREALLRTYQILARLPTGERLAFSLRLLEQASAEEIARLCGSSVRTVKRRLRSGRMRFLSLASRDPVLGPRLSNLSSAEDGDDG